MTGLSKLAGLSHAHRRLLLRALLTVAAFRLSLTVLPYRWTRRLAEGASGAGGDARPRPTRDELAWAVSAASRRIPRATCLTQALALQRLLGGAGYDATLRLGVARSDGGTLEAHAWLESGGRTVIGGPQSARYVPLPLRTEPGA
jgi:hypothetical protein